VTTRRAPRRLTGLVVVALYAATVTAIHFVAVVDSVKDRWSVPIDDTYIHFQYARGIAEGHPFSYHAGDGYTSGSTSPLYAILLSIFYWIGLRQLSLVPLVLVLGGFWLAASILLLARIGRQLGSPQAGRIAAALFGTFGFTWYCLYSGMETGLYVTLLLGTLSAFLAARARSPLRPPWPMLVLGGLLPVTRPDGLFFLLAVLLVSGARIASRRAEPLAARLRGLLRLSPSLVPAALYFGANLLLAGSLMTAGATSKSLLGAPYLDVPRRAVQLVTQLLEVWDLFLDGKDPLYLGLVLSLVGLAAIIVLASRELARGVPGGRVLLGLFLVIAVFAASMHYIRIARWTRYYLPFFIVVLLGAGLAAAWVAQALGRWRLAAGPGIALVLLQLGTIPGWLKAYQQDVKVIDTKQAAAGRAALALPASSRILVCDAGAIPYISGRWTFDVVGLTSPVRKNYFRNGVGSRFELFEHLPPGRRPTHVAAYDFCIWPGARGEPLGIFHDLVLAPFTDTGAGTGHSPASSTGGLRVTDRVDVADLESEDAHAYAFEPGRVGAPQGPRHEVEAPTDLDIFRTNVLLRAKVVGTETILSDGGRLTSAERFRLPDVRGGKALTLLGRYSTPRPLDLVVSVDGGPRRVAKLSPQRDGGFVEARVTIPASEVRPGCEVLLFSARGIPYQSFHHFALQ
jgi:hypothetical protein